MTRWSVTEVKRLRAAIARGLTSRDIARELNRPLQSIYTKISTLGLARPYCQGLSYHRQRIAARPMSVIDRFLRKPTP